MSPEVAAMLQATCIIFIINRASFELARTIPLFMNNCFQNCTNFFRSISKLTITVRPFIGINISIASHIYNKDDLMQPSLSHIYLGGYLQMGIFAFQKMFLPFPLCGNLTEVGLMVLYSILQGLGLVQASATERWL